MKKEEVIFRKLYDEAWEVLNKNNQKFQHNLKWILHQQEKLNQGMDWDEKLQHKLKKILDENNDLIINHIKKKYNKSD